VAFFPIYYVFPDVDVTAWEILPGVVVAAVGWALLQGLFQIYVAHSTAGGTDIVTGIMLLLTWLYFTGVVLLLGAVINAVRGGYTKQRA
jgi:membrane protein